MPARKKPKSGWTLYFDLDDTLIFTQYKYNIAAMGCTATLLREFGLQAPHPKSVLEYFGEVDLRNTEQHGFGKFRFAGSWQETYEHFAASLGVPVREMVSIELAGLAGAVTNPPHLIRPEAKSVLAAVRPLVAEMFILTMGEKRVQAEKVEHLPEAVQRSFDGVAVVPRKDVRAFRRMLGDRDPAHCIMVGNSLRSDVLPAIESGAWAIHLPVETWAYERQEPVVSEMLFTVNSLKQVPRVVRGIVA